MASDSDRRAGGVFLVAGGLFIVAGLTGALFRFGGMWGLPWGLTPVNVRHAHSHLMFFGWLTPALMALIVAARPRRARWERRLTTGSMWAALAFGLLAWITFLLHGYELVAVGDAQLPLSVIVSTLNMFAWYGFAAAAFAAAWRGANRIRVAIAFLCLSSLGAWGVGAAQMALPGNRAALEATKAFFLEGFTHGWLLVGLLALVMERTKQDAQAPGPAVSVDPPDQRMARGFALVAISAPAMFLLAIPQDLQSSLGRILAAGAGLTMALGLALAVRGLWSHSRTRPAWRVPTAFLGAKSLLVLVAAVGYLTQWFPLGGWRILYLHVFLLGFGATGIVAAATDAGWVTPGHAKGFGMATVVLVVSLVPISPIWPQAWHSPVWQHLAAWSTLLPVIGMIRVCLTALTRGSPAVIMNSSPLPPRLSE